MQTALTILTISREYNKRLFLKLLLLLGGCWIKVKHFTNNKLLTRWVALMIQVEKFVGGGGVVVWWWGGG